MTENYKTKRVLLTLVVFFTSVSFLIYEVTWDRILGLYLGTTVHASTIVISAFMAGLGTGSYFLGKKADKTKYPVGFLGRLLITIGIVNLIVYLLLQLIPKIYKYNAVNDLLGDKVEIVVYIYALSIVFASAFFIGGIMPIVTRIYLFMGNNISNSIGNTFAADTFGSSLGGLLAGFVLLRYPGMKGTVFIVSSMNLILAWITGIMINHKISQSLIPEEKLKIVKPVELKTQGREHPKFSMLVAFISGLTGLIAQIIWLRIFKIYLTNTSYTFALIVSVIIFGYFLGSLLFKKITSDESDILKNLLLGLFATGTIIAVGVLVFVNAPRWIIIPLHEVLTSPVSRILLPPVILSILTVLPQAVLAGFVFTSAVRLYSDKSQMVSLSFSRVYFINTIGGFIGPFIAAFLLIPYAGVVRSLLIIALINIAVSIYLIYRNKPSIRGYIFVFQIVILIIVTGAVFITRIKVMPPSFSMSEREILFYEEAVEATLVVGKDKTSGVNYTYFNNNSVIGSSYDAIKAVKLLGHIPFLTGHDPKKVLIVGFGIGVTTSTVLSHPEVESVLCVELAEELKNAAKFYKELNHNVVEDRRLKIIGNDGRHYLQSSTEKFDLISSDPTHPVLGSGSLYSQEYFQLCYDHLSDNGMVTQYLPMHKLLTKDYIGILKTFNSVFPNTTLWLGHTHTLLVGTKKPMKIDFADFKVKASKINDIYLYSEPYSLASFLIYDSNSIAELDKNSVICHDDNSYLDFFEMDSFLPMNWVYNAEYILKNIKSTDVFFNVDNVDLLEKFKLSTLIVLEGLIQSMSGNPKGYVEKLYQAQRINPENQEIPFLIKLESMKK
ncbi:MAG: fused MFS/spermidine synthase [Candidatus Delongbacteria bacterium]|nr:fused MFS/spermidine synthase [Candidatus Delongbacteria bacterium]